MRAIYPYGNGKRRRRRRRSSSSSRMCKLPCGCPCTGRAAVLQRLPGSHLSSVCCPAQKERCVKAARTSHRHLFRRRANTWHKRLPARVFDGWRGTLPLENLSGRSPRPESGLRRSSPFGWRVRPSRYGAAVDAGLNEVARPSGMAERWPHHSDTGCCAAPRQQVWQLAHHGRPERLDVCPACKCPDTGSTAPENGSRIRGAGRGGGGK